MNKNTKELKHGFLCVLGTLFFAVGVNCFIVPLGLYSGGFVGIAQIIRTILIDYLKLPFKNVDIAGIIYFAVNIPLFIMAFRTIGRVFFMRTVLSVITETIFLTIIKAPAVPILDDTLANCIIGGLISGYGIGLTLKEGGSAGGLDILGIYFSKKYSNISVGKINIFVNLIVYGICAILFNISVVIYSLIYMACYSVVIDKTHYQNINVNAMIFTENDEIAKELAKKMRRGVTTWIGEGAYTGKTKKVVYTVVSKYEIASVKELVTKMDPNAFIVLQEGLSIKGNFEKRLY